ncbi:PAS domain-containing protein [Nodosilinea sp. LEGE 07298]|nr:PAS domain-containing protein [Nodosilinea sp. LEGE 07298]
MNGGADLLSDPAIRQSSCRVTSMYLTFDTERKQAEEALRVAEENYRSIFENALEGIFQSSPEGYFIRVNPALAKIYGYDSPHDMIQSITNISKQLYVDAERRAEFITAIEKHGTIKDFEYRGYCKNGSIIWTQIDARAVTDGNGRVIYYEGIVQDITERKQQEESWKQQLQELQIEIDHKQRARQVAEISSTDYFQKLMAEADNLRNFNNEWS